MNTKFVKVGDNFLNIRYIKKVTFEKDFCSFTIANTEMVSVAAIPTRSRDDKIITENDMNVCQQVKKLFYYEN